MAKPVSKNFNLRWHQHDNYIISLSAAHLDNLSPYIVEALTAAGMKAYSPRIMTMEAGRDWKPVWDTIYAALAKVNAAYTMDAAVTPAQEAVETTQRKPAAVMQTISESLWLGDALLEDRVICYLQPVVGAGNEAFGYESFARVRSPDGVIGGDRIIAASRALGIEYAIDRHLHVQAIKTFVTSAFNGFLFVNLFPGFIHRPEVYLENLSDTAKKLGIVASHIVLDLARCETPYDAVHLKSVCEYARSRGMSIALDDIESLSGARKLVPDVRPDFVKLDSKLTRKADTQAIRKTIRLIVDLVHANGGKVIAEGVETQPDFEHLKAQDVDLFQGYLFSPPMPVESALKQKIN